MSVKPLRDDERADWEREPENIEKELPRRFEDLNNSGKDRNRKPKYKYRCKMIASGSTNFTSICTDISTSRFVLSTGSFGNFIDGWSSLTSGDQLNKITREYCVLRISTSILSAIRSPCSPVLQHLRGALRSPTFSDASHSKTECANNGEYQKIKEGKHARNSHHQIITKENTQQQEIEGEIDLARAHS